MTTPPLQSMVESLHLLSVEELDTLINAARYMRGVLSPSVEDDGEEELIIAPVPLDRNTASPSRNGRGGWIEFKMIPREGKNGNRKLYGPYRYRRKWVRRGGRLVCTSTYVGKVN